MEKVILASNNAHKLKEIQAILSDFEYELVSMKAAGLEMDIEETGTTFEENSLIKAEAVVKATGHIAIADDSGLEVDYLKGAPGVYSARYAGEPCDDYANNEKLLKALEGVKDENRSAKFVSVITMLFPGGKKIVARGEVKGCIASNLLGDDGFGYDPLFVYKNKLSFGQMKQVEKNKISHRYNSLLKLKECLKND
jgi:XTP/dITP diphosphohydrolase